MVLIHTINNIFSCLIFKKENLLKTWLCKIITKLIEFFIYKLINKIFKGDLKVWLNDPIKKYIKNRWSLINVHE